MEAFVLEVEEERREYAKKMLLEQARSTFWRMWAAKHEYEELISGSSQLWLCCEGKQRRSGLTSIVMSQGSWFWKEVECRKDSSTLAGQMNANAKPVTKRKVQKSTGFTIVQDGMKGMKSGARSQRPA